MKKFDVIIMNPPYATTRLVEFKKSNQIWHRFVSMANNLLVAGGHLVAVHPSGWRSPSKYFDLAKKTIYNNNLKYLEIHGLKDGNKTFGCQTRYDWYVLAKENYSGSTTIVDQDGIIADYNIQEMIFIPNGEIPFVLSLVTDEKKNK